MFTLKTASKYILSPVNNTGFTLLEIMISVSIIALILTSLFRMHSGTIELAAAGKFNSLAPVLAQQLLIKIEHDPANWSEFEGDFKETFPGFTWSCKISDSFFDELDFINGDNNNGENNNSFKKIEIEILNSPWQRSYKVTTWRFVIE
jgi:prepilin-type N-terminal cleavage/methylation domain-containing protein